MLGCKMKRTAACFVRRFFLFGVVNWPAQARFHENSPMGLYGSDDNRIECLREKLRAGAASPSTR
jgi:hypothetical protein